MNIPYRPWILPMQPPHGQLFSTFPPDSEFGDIVQRGMMDAEKLFAAKLIRELTAEGAIVEFGVFDGRWLQTLIQAKEDCASDREVWGFDSFEGLPETTEHDLDCWKRGDYACDIETVRQRLRADERPWLKLRKGWFKDTLPKAIDLKMIAFARIDCDLYAPAVECLDFITSRLSNNSILVFDDWTYNPDKGETKAFLEWLNRNPKFKPELLAANSIGHLYFRISF